MATYLITGGGGFIGSNIVEELVRSNQRVRVLDNFATGRRENLIPFMDKIEVVEGDLKDLETVRQAARSIDYVLHQGALPSVPRSIEQPTNTNDVNVTGTLNVLVASRDEGVKKVVLASSSSVYGNTHTLPKRETMEPVPLSPYAVSKLACEHYARVFWTIYGLPTVTLRYFNVFGPRQNPHSQYSAVIPIFIKALANGQRPVIYGDGSQSRDFSYVENVVMANVLAVHEPGANGKVMNIACQEAITLNDLVKELNSILGTSIEPEYKPERTGDVKHSLADIGLAQAVMNYAPRVRWREGLRRTVERLVESWKR
ncbi:MAG: SDR family oxidoreductase [Ignavibacteriales bacterium]|nr:SDR family oxidoreductase [Ignavibacteriales bacterium]